MRILHATSPDHYAAMLAAHPRLLVDYCKDDCPGCRMLDASLQKAAASGLIQDIPVLKVQLEVVGEALFRGLGLRQTPTLSLFADGVEIARLPGFQAPAQIMRALAEGFAQVSA
ncbi:MULTISPECIES: thioredoxin family protein [unclassified Luteimonas]